MNDRSLQRKFFHFTLFLGCIFILGVLWLSYDDVLFETDSLKALVERAGFFGPLIFIGTVILEVVVAPIPGAVFPVIAGFLFGFWEGVLYSYIGNLLGTLAAFLLARAFGQPFIAKLISVNKLTRANTLLTKYSRHLFWLYAMPIFPLDIISFLLGVSSLSFKKFAIIVSFSFIPNILLLNFFGTAISGLSLQLVSFLALVFFVIFFIIFLLYPFRKS